MHHLIYGIMERRPFSLAMPYPCQERGVRVANDLIGLTPEKILRIKKPRNSEMLKR